MKLGRVIARPKIRRHVEALLDATLAQFDSEHGDLLDALITNLTTLRQQTADGAHKRRRQPINDAFGRLTNRVSPERVLRADGIHVGEPPDVSPRYQPTRGT